METITLEGKVNKGIAGYWSIQTKYDLEALRGKIVTIQIVGVKDASESTKKVN